MFHDCQALVIVCMDMGLEGAALSRHGRSRTDHFPTIAGERVDRFHVPCKTLSRYARTDRQGRSMECCGQVEPRPAIDCE